MKLPYLIGQSVYLRPLDVPDAETCVRWLMHPDTRHFVVGGRRPISVGQEIDWIKRATASPNQVTLVIARVADDQPLGLIGLTEIEPIDRDAMLGITLGEEAVRGKGTGTEAIGLLLDYAFETLNLHRVQLEVLADNARAIRCYEKSGFVVEGRLREASFARGRYVDVLTMGILAAEYWVRKSPRAS